MFVVRLHGMHEDDRRRKRMLMDPDNATGASEQPADDLRAVKGIGRETARRLHDAGLGTFIDLARHSASEIATKAHVPVPRVEREDWIGQARELAERSSRTGAEGSETAIDDAEHRESFILRLTLDDDNKVIRTLVTHVRSEREAPPWAGWDTAQLLEFLSEYCDLGEKAEATPTGGTVASAASVGDPEPARQAIAATGKPELAPLTPPPPSEVWLRELEVVSATSGAPQRSLNAGEPFAVRLAFDLQGAEAVSRAPLAYTASIFARTMGESRRQPETVGEDAGTLEGTGRAILEVRSTGLPPGTYRLEGTLRLRDPDSTRPRRLATLKGGLLQVY
jgi:hypothetical protein